jgi:glycosyltransferase involved in cell wall biosynthesis
VAEPMRIGLLIHSLDGGGAEAVARLWVTELSARGHRLVCLVYGPTQYQPTNPAIEVISFPGSSAAQRWAKLSSWVRREASAHALDAVVSVLDFSSITLLRAFGGRSDRPALVLTEHSVPDLMWRHEGAGGHVKRLLAKGLYRRADAVVAVSHAVATDLRVAQAISAERLFVLPNAVSEVESALGDADGRLTAGRPSGAPDDVSGEPRLLYVGRLSPEKRPDRFLDTMRELRDRGIGWRGLVIGAGSELASLQESVVRDGLPIDFAGWVQPWQRLVRPGDCLLLTSDVEGLGNVLIESAIVGVPCVAPSSALGVADAVVSGVTGVLARSPRPVDLADAVVEAAALRWDPAAVTGWLRNFEPGVAAERLEEIIRAVVVGTNRSTAPVVTHVGPPPGMQGGMSSVLTDYTRMPFARVKVRFCPSYSDESRSWSIGPFLRAVTTVSTRPRRKLGILHVHLSEKGSFIREGGVLLAARRRGLPVVVTLHGANLAEFQARFPRIVAAVLSRADVIIALGPAFRELLPPPLRAKVVVVPNAAALPGGPISPAGSNGPVALFAGEVSRRKGVDVLVQAWPRVREISPDARLEIAGPPGDFIPVRVDSVEWLGPLPREEIQRRLTACRLAVLPSRHEAMPMFLLEAMAAARPVVSTPVGDIVDLVDDTGLIVAAADSAGLADALGRLLTERETATRLGALARERVESGYGLAAVAAKLDEVYDLARRLRATPPTAAPPAGTAARPEVAAHSGGRRLGRR